MRQRYTGESCADRLRQQGLPAIEWDGRMDQRGHPIYDHEAVR